MADLSANADGGTGKDGGVQQQPTGLPCDVTQLLSNYCTGCHSNPPLNGAPMPLVTLADLTGQSMLNPAATVAQRCLYRMQNSQSPMPPAGPGVPAADIMSFAAWIQAGTPMGTGCPVGTDLAPPPGDLPPPGDMPPPGDGGNPFGGPPVCTSGMTWSNGNHGSPLMHPGDACINCHSMNHGPSFSVAGTVYPTAHEPDDCLSTAGPTVEITDATGTLYSLSTNANGNFYHTSGLTPPYQVKVTYNGRERVMHHAQMSGDCNGCHTQDGANGAPGRILSP
jgi:hypothetical protein